jgi:predicted ATPase
MLVAAGLGLIGRIRITVGRPGDRSGGAEAARTRRSAGPMTANSSRRGRALGLLDRRSERDTLDRLIEAVRACESQALVLRGDPGMGKTMLLDHLAGRASGAGCRVARAVGMQSEMELAFAGVHQLCAPMLGHAERLPVPQRDALRTAFGIAAGPPPDRFFVGLAVLSLLS